MSPMFILACVAGYFVFLLLIAWFTSRRADNASYFLGNKASPWIAVAFGLLGDSLSGVSFISVPGQVSEAKFSYLQIVFGYVLGYVVIAQVLLPLYYRLNLTSIYSFLRNRFGPASQKSGAFFFLLSRITGAAARLYLATSVLQFFVLDYWGVPFWCTVSLFIFLILIYTIRGGIRTLVWTDVFQSSFLLLGVILSIIGIARELGLGLNEVFSSVTSSEYGQIFFWDWQDKKYFWKQFVSGAFIAIVMTGLDQNMMQKNLSCRTLRDAQKNIYWFTVVMVIVNVLFLSLGVLLYQYAKAKGISNLPSTDQLFPTLALKHLGMFAAVVFILGLTAATFSSADSVLTTLTTSFCIDFIDIDQKTHLNEEGKAKLRRRIHFLFAVLLLIVILAFKALNSSAVITAVFTMAGYTYGPLLGLFAFGLFMKWTLKDQWVPIICAISPVLCFLFDRYSVQWLGGYRFGFELLILNGLLTFVGLCLLRRPGTVKI